MRSFYVFTPYSLPSPPPHQARRTRPVCPYHAKGVGAIDVHDRSTAHFAAWHSPKRPAAEYGRHFNLEDARVWMRIHFWAAREEGLMKHEGFADYYVSRDAQSCPHKRELFDSSRTAMCGERGSPSLPCPPTLPHAHLQRLRRQTFFTPS